MLFRLYNPEVFQGNLRKKHYFEGWYFKHVTHNPSHSFSFIPGISLGENDSHAFIQVMNGYTGKTSYIRYPIDEFKPELKRMAIRVGGSEFPNDHLHLDINSDNIRLTGQIDYHNMVKYPKRLLSPGIMGWYSFIPFMECNHGIMSVIHDLSGSISFEMKPYSIIINDKNNLPLKIVSYYINLYSHSYGKIKHFKFQVLFKYCGFLHDLISPFCPIKFFRNMGF